MTALFDETKDKEAALRKFVWNFGYIHGNNKKSKERKVEMIIQNIGGTVLEWNFKISD